MISGDRNAMREIYKRIKNKNPEFYVSLDLKTKEGEEGNRIKKKERKKEKLNRNVYLFRTEPDGRSCLAMKNNACAWHRGRVIGGSSTINGMIYVRGSPHDYDEWRRLGNPGENGWESKIVNKLM